MHVRLYNGPCADGYMRERGDPPVWGIYCPHCVWRDKGKSSYIRVHEVQHPEPGPAMDWARVHDRQHHAQIQSNMGVAA